MFVTRRSVARDLSTWMPPTFHGRVTACVAPKSAAAVGGLCAPTQRATPFPKQPRRVRASTGARACDPTFQHFNPPELGTKHQPFAWKDSMQIAGNLPICSERRSNSRMQRAEAAQCRLCHAARPDTGMPRIAAPRRVVWNPTVRISGRRRARWACGQAGRQIPEVGAGSCPNPAHAGLP
jgi:hypothetical protein